MISLDTNVVFSALNPTDSNHSKARQLLSTHGSAEALVLCPIVFAELVASPDRPGIEVFLQKAQIEVLWEFEPSTWDKAGVAFGNYARLRKGGTLPRRMVADFVIAAHAQQHGLGVMTFDDTVYKAVFPQIKLIS